MALAVLFLVAFAGLSLAENISDFDVQLSMYCPNNLSICDVSPYLGSPGNPAAGLANFSPINKAWSYNFLTANPVSWKCDSLCDSYDASFGVGGNFLMNGPDGMTFTGQITSGTAWEHNDLSWGASLSFSGQWSNGYTATGSFIDQVTDEFGPYASLNVDTVPEPASLTLMGGGVLAAWRARKRIRF